METITPATRNIASDLQLFFDEWLIQDAFGARLKLHHPHPKGVVLEFDRPWEGSTSGVGVSVIKEGDRYRMWYVGGDNDADDDGKKPDVKLRWSCYAESGDGIKWERPDLGIIDFAGSSRNNIIMGAKDGWNLCPFIDENPDPHYPQKYKGIGRLARTKAVDMKALLRGYVSDDGLHWQVIDKDPLMVSPPTEYMPRFDSPISAFWDGLRGCYVAYMRGIVPPGKSRAIRRSVSTDFRSWTTPEFIGLGDSPTEELYMSAATPYFRAPHIYLSFPKRYYAPRTLAEDSPGKGISETCFMAGRDGVNFSRTFMEAFIKPGPDIRNWYKHNTMVGTGVVPTGPGELSLYYLEHHGYPSARLRRAAIRTDGFVSVNTPYAGGELVTKPFTFAGNELVINYATSVAGTLRVELQDPAGRAIEGFSLEDCDEIYGDEIERVVAWRSGADVSAFAAKPVRLRFVMTKEVDLYSLQFRHATGGSTVNQVVGRS